ncbi:MAG: hypothetical protein P1U46_02945 [Patescibacteria group bacterium]|nr:hypothetical protein [Patescibacteria group bacterium]
MNSAEKIQYNNDSISWEEILERFIIKSNNYDHLKTIFKGRNFKEYN